MEEKSIERRLLKRHYVIGVIVILSGGFENGVYTVVLYPHHISFCIEPV